MLAISLARGRGCTVWDKDGRAYLDLLAGTWCNVLGYGHPRLVEAIQDQARHLVHVGAPFSTREVGESLRRLGGVVPSGLDRAVFLNTGSEAVELALKMARAATGSDGLVITERGYYGATAYALSLSEAGRAASYLPRPEGVLCLPAPTCYSCPVGASPPCGDFPCLDSLRAAAEEGPGRLAAVLYEPLLTAGGVIVPPQGYGAALAELAKRSGALLIAEEVTTGMGRTGRWFACEHDGVTPDILVVGKALGAGLPVAAVVTSEEVEASASRALRHVQSHQNDPFSGRIASTVIDVLEEEGLVERAALRGDHFLERLAELEGRSPFIKGVHGKGLALAIELEQGEAPRGERAFYRLLEAGFITDYQRKTATFRLFPPYVISAEEIDRFTDAFESAIGD
jgi:4-aminobutyrate aminotransferase-like enzyme